MPFLHHLDIHLCHSWILPTEFHHLGRYIPVELWRVENWINCGPKWKKKSKNILLNSRFGQYWNNLFLFSARIPSMYFSCFSQSFLYFLTSCYNDIFSTRDKQWYQEQNYLLLFYIILDFDLGSQLRISLNFQIQNISWTRHFPEFPQLQTCSFPNFPTSSRRSFALARVPCTEEGRTKRVALLLNTFVCILKSIFCLKINGIAKTNMKEHCQFEVPYYLIYPFPLSRDYFYIKISLEDGVCL